MKNGKLSASLHLRTPTQTGFLSISACFLSKWTWILLQTDKSHRGRVNTPPASKKETVGFLNCDKGEQDPSKDSKPGLMFAPNPLKMLTVFAYPEVNGFSLFFFFKMI